MTLTHVVQYTLLSDDTDTRSAVYSLPGATDTRSAVYSTPDDTDTRSAVYSTLWWHWHT